MECPALSGCTVPFLFIPYVSREGSGMGIPTGIGVEAKSIQKGLRSTVILCVSPHFAVQSYSLIQFIQKKLMIDLSVYKC